MSFNQEQETVLIERGDEIHAAFSKCIEAQFSRGIENSLINDKTQIENEENFMNINILCTLFFCSLKILHLW